jgi:short-subunit dehydrogenase
MPERRPITLITGASAGIGAALARVFAANGHETVLVARRMARLRAVADALIQANGKPAHVMAMDLTRTTAADDIARELEARDLEPEIVVNSAGFGLYGLASELSREEQLAMIDLNVRALTELSMRFLDSVGRHRGGILNVGSILGYVPGPQMAVYHATKAFVLSFSEALHRELRLQGIRVTALCPGPVDTEFAVRPTGYFGRKSRRNVDRIAKEGYNGFMKGQRVVVSGFDPNMMRLLPRLLPRGLMLTLLANLKRARFEAAQH